MLKLGGEACVCQPHAEPVPGTRRGACSVLHSPPGTGPVHVHSCLPSQGLCKHWEASHQGCSLGAPSRRGSSLEQGRPFTGLTAQPVWLHPRERTPTHPPLVPSEESRKWGRVKTEEKRRAKNFGVTHRRPCWVLCTARHLTHKVTSLPAEPSFPVLFCN